MLNVVRNASVLQSVVFNKTVTGILQNNKSSLSCFEKLFYSSGPRKTSEKLNSNLKDGNDPAMGTGTTTQKKNFSSPKITVFSSDSKLTVMTLEEAQKLSKRRDLKLVKVSDADHNTRRPVYKLMTGAEFYEEDLRMRKEKVLKKSQEAKDPKLVTLSSKISDHDLSSKIKNMVKWLNKRHEVRIIVNIGENNEGAEHIYKRIETETKNAGKVVQKRHKDGNLKFQLVTLKKKSTDSDEDAPPETDPITQPTES